MKAERQQKEPQKAEPIQSKRERSHLSFEDNRSQTACQTKLIHSIQKKENKIGLPNDLKTDVENLSGFSISPIYQLTIDRSKLNVAGEEHNESNSRRKDEIAFCREKMGKENDFYWVENEFKNQDGKQADPQRLLLDQALSFLVEYKDKESNQLDIMTIANNLKKQIDGYTIAQELRLLGRSVDLFLKYGDEFQGVIDDIGELTKIQYPLTDTKMPVALKVAIDEIVIKRENIPLDIMPALGKSMEVRKKRSEEMHKAANSSNKKGVWKIGQDHVEDIISEELNYNLINLNEFNEEYKTWEKGRVKSSPSTRPTH